jgi:hypothetical protein
MRTYVSASDSFLSGWGDATGKTSKFVVVCDTQEEVLKTKKWMESQGCFHHIQTHDSKPYFPPGNYHVSIKDYDECGAIHRM